MVHGSENPAIGNVYPYMLVAQGVSVFVYDKRGTGASEGDYTQNFELLADDAAAAPLEHRAADWRQAVLKSGLLRRKSGRMGRSTRRHAFES